MNTELPVLNQYETYYEFFYNEILKMSHELNEEWTLKKQENRLITAEI